MTIPPEEPAPRFGGVEYPALEHAHPADPLAPVDYPASAGLPPPVYPGAPGYPGAGYPPAQPGYPYAPAQPYGAYRQHPPPGTNGMAIAALVCSVLGFLSCLTGTVGLVLGIIAMRETKRTGQQGYGMALAATIIGGLLTALLVLFLLAGVISALSSA
ncbi:DUF4190 domain-containing protein [Mycolicibacterium sp.]|uniref:DUF4190 domain-containing protein n=1 Tax=Mycolicibacterium sp. TaxID=2320850 RepID=UPI0037C50F77